MKSVKGKQDVKTCPKESCGHIWIARKPGGGKRCPQCQTPLKGSK